MRWISWWAALSVTAIAAALVYALVLFLIGRRQRVHGNPGELFFVILIPCLNEEIVIGRTIQRLLSQRRHNLAVLVIDDGSDDATSAIAQTFSADRVWLLRREQPNARQGKGEALNAGFRYLCESDLLRGRPSNRVIVGVLDADGRLDDWALDCIEGSFVDSRTGAVQISVRMYNRGSSLLARLQDIEFGVFGEVFQRGRDRLGSVGLGGNGQFTRLLALRSVGSAPWSRCLTEDLALSVDLHARGWNILFRSDVAVSQQAVVDGRRLLRQRTRWFQGYLQCLSSIPLILGTPKASIAKRVEVSTCLGMPVLQLANSLAVLVGYVLLAVNLATGRVSLELSWWWLPLLYGLSFVTIPLVAFACWRRLGCGPIRAFLYAHLYVLYTLIWIPAAARAISRQLRGIDRWDKTARTMSSAELIDLREVTEDVTLGDGVRVA